MILCPYCSEHQTALVNTEVVSGITVSEYVCMTCLRHFEVKQIRGREIYNDIEEYEEEDYESDPREESFAKGELKPCPFCGKDVELKHHSANGTDWWYIVCNHCEIAIDPLMWYINRTRKEITKIWNKRAKE